MTQFTLPLDIKSLEITSQAIDNQGNIMALPRFWGKCNSLICKGNSAL